MNTTIKKLRCEHCHDVFDEHDAGIVPCVEMHDIGEARVRQEVVTEVCPTCGSDWLTDHQDEEEL